MTLLLLVLVQHYIMTLRYYIVWTMVIMKCCQIYALLFLFGVCFFLQKFRDDDKVFYCIRAPERVFEAYRYLLKVSDACNWSCEQQGTIPQSTR